MNLKSNILVETRLKEFHEINQSDSDRWFSELCFCILTANSKAQTAINIQYEVGIEGFKNYSQEKLSAIIRQNKHRFHNNKSKYIVEARKFLNIKDILKQFKNGIEAREFLAKTVKGLGFKESSHFLRNVGYSDVAIIDRHILRFMLANKLISEIPKSIKKSDYLKFEDILRSIDPKLDRLDLIIWEKVTGKVLK